MEDATLIWGVRVKNGVQGSSPCLTTTKSVGLLKTTKCWHPFVWLKPTAKYLGLLTQLVECRAHNARVVGSSPTRTT